jgi:hypothetical protein
MATRSDLSSLTDTGERGGVKEDTLSSMEQGHHRIVSNYDGLDDESDDDDGTSYTMEENITIGDSQANYHINSLDPGRRSRRRRRRKGRRAGSSVNSMSSKMSARVAAAHAAEASLPDRALAMWEDIRLTVAGKIEALPSSTTIFAAIPTLTMSCSEPPTMGLSSSSSSALSSSYSTSSESIATAIEDVAKRQRKISKLLALKRELVARRQADVEAKFELDRVENEESVMTKTRLQLEQAERLKTIKSDESGNWSEVWVEEGSSSSSEEDVFYGSVEEEEVEMKELTA